MDKLTGSLNDFRDVIGVEVGALIKDYNKTYSLGKIARRLSVSPSYISLLSAGKFELVSLKTILLIATRLGIHYRIEINNDLNKEELEIIYDFQYTKTRDRIIQFEISEKAQ